jgi:hypothetical protein
MSARLLMVRELRRPDRDDPGSRDVVDSIARGMDAFSVAVQLWRLVDAHRAERIEAIYARVSRRAGLTDDDIRYEADDLRELVALFDGLRAALEQAAIVNHELKIEPDKVAELAPKLPALDLRATRPAGDVVWALAEGIVNVEGLRQFIADAISRGCDVVASY